jgi:hypothetical protein
MVLILVFIPILIIAICVIFLRRYFYDMLVYYDIIKSKPSFEYPLSNLALKIKIRDLKKNKYIQIYKIKKELQKK